MKKFLKKYKVPLLIVLGLALVAGGLRIAEILYSAKVQTNLYQGYMHAIKQRNKDASRAYLAAFFKEDKGLLKARDTKAYYSFPDEELEKFCSIDPDDNSIFSIITAWEEAARDWDAFVDDNYSSFNINKLGIKTETESVSGQLIEGIALGRDSMLTNVSVEYLEYNERDERVNPVIVLTTTNLLDDSFGGINAEQTITLGAEDVPFILDSLYELANELCTDYLTPHIIPFADFDNPESEPNWDTTQIWNPFQETESFNSSSETGN